MGLDIAEMMIAFEETFNVDICEGEAQRIETVEDMVNLISRAVVDAPKTVEEAMERRAEGMRLATEALSETLGVDRSTLTEQTPLEPLFPMEHREEYWNRLRERLPDRIPELCEMPIFSCLGFLAGNAVLAGLLWIGTVWASQYFTPDAILSAGIAFGATGFFTIFFLVQRRKTQQIPWDYRTVGMLARCLVPDKICAPPNGVPWTREMVEQGVKRIVAEQIGSKPEKIALSTKFSELF